MAPEKTDTHHVVAVRYNRRNRTRRDRVEEREGVGGDLVFFSLSLFSGEDASASLEKNKFWAPW